MEWLLGWVDPEALLAFVTALDDRGARVRLFTSPLAHAKMYVGSNGVIVGSSNLSLRGFGAGPEIVSLAGQNHVRPARRSANRYLDLLQLTSFNVLRDYVEGHAKAAKEARQRRLARGRPDEDTLPPVRVQGRRAVSPETTDHFWSGSLARSLPPLQKFSRARKGKGTFKAIYIEISMDCVSI